MSRPTKPAGTEAPDTETAGTGTADTETAGTGAGAAGPQQQQQQESAPPEDVQATAMQSTVSVLTTLGPPVTIATALMIYFGWARTQQQARYMGLDGSLFGYTAQDYMLRSINTLFIPLLVMSVLVLGWLTIHTRIAGSLRRPKRRALLYKAGRGIFAIGLTTAAGSVLVVTIDRSIAPLAVPLALATGTAVAAYGQWLVTAASPPSRTARPATMPWQRALRTLMVGGIIALALFWELSEYAGVVGRGTALQIARSVDSLPRATVFSTIPLGIEAPGVHEERVDAGSGEAQARFRTTGLRLMVRSGGRVFLLHEKWTPQRGTVVVLPDSDAVSWQFAR